MKLPRDLTGSQLIKYLEVFGYQITRQIGSHIRVTTLQNGQHH
jgi:predicted RNA binding protein YcfA (HicA-like mRNA interferase family)